MIKLVMNRNSKGVTLVELLVVLVVFGIISAGSYRLFISQNRAYTIQDQVVEVQQSVRTAMERILRDLRVAGYDDDNVSSPYTISNPINYPVAADSITLNYEYYDTTTLQYQLKTITYSVNGTDLILQETVNGALQFQETLLEHVDALTFTYAVDANDDKAIDDQNGDGQIDDSDFIAAANVGTRKVVAVRVQLTARPDPVNPDVQNTVSPRTLVSAVTFRNLCLR